ncbi:MAG: 50S ribosomal protein L31 [Deltaproteobacteria bacterium]|nr:50S ribosomal protein L31 [Deltaproteobacteria bacterium]MCX7953351.1 50S ribosomal protein L31 [Deltaproteobacteria bacterium]
MKEGVHPTFYPDAKVVCSGCGAVYVTGGSVPEIRVGVCRNCHPFFTGEEKIIDVEGRVDKFKRKYGYKK